MDNAKQQVVDRLKQATNVLVTVSANPSVDQLAACIGLTLFLNKLGKHGTAVFSGSVPSTIEFLEPEKTLEKTTDSLRDFIIALDKSKADKLRYKVEENVVKIFITPYRTSISQKDLDFSQGDFNVDVVLALGVAEQAQLDQAITSHGRILHDATVVSINNGQGGELGSIHWQEGGASSLSEMVVTLGDALDKTLLDGQIATALLTGIVAETNRFSNEKTTPTTMSISSELMTAGANQQLVATKLQEPPPKPPEEKKPDAPVDPPTPTEGGEPAPVEPPKPDDGTLEIEHDLELPAPVVDDEPEDSTDPSLSQIHVDKEGTMHNLDAPVDPAVPEPSLSEPVAEPVLLPEPTPAPAPGPDPNDVAPRIMTTPPAYQGLLTANSHPEDLDPTSDAMSLPAIDTPFLSHDHPADQSMLPQPREDSMLDKETLTGIEQDVQSPHLLQTPAPESHQEPAPTIIPPDPPSEPIIQPTTPPAAPVDDLDQARNAVEAAIAADPEANAGPLPPIDALNAQPVFESLNAAPMPLPVPAPGAEHMVNPSPAPSVPHSPEADDQPMDAMNMPLPSAAFVPNPNPVIQPTAGPSPMSPPPVPPPMMQFPSAPPKQ